jgi:SAM-dependent methyltransferase
VCGNYDLISGVVKLSLSKSSLQLLAAQAVPMLGSRREACILGFPRIVSSATELSDIFGIKIPESTFSSVLGSLGFDRQVVLDVSDYEDADIVDDLNIPVPAGTPKFDFVVDNGTIEHCFNVGQALMNCANICAVGGVIFHNNPANWFNHGFWNFSPCTFFDFYEANGFSVRVFLRDCGNGKSRELEYKPKVTKILPQRRYVIHAICKKIEDKPLKFPMQRRYTEHRWLEDS